MKYKIEFYANGELQVETKLFPKQIQAITKFIKKMEAA